MAGFAEELENVLENMYAATLVVEYTAEAIPVHRDMHDLSLQITILLGKLKVAAIASEAATWNLPEEFSNLVMRFTELQDVVGQVLKVQRLKRLAMECKLWEPAEGGDNEDTQI